MNYGKRRRIQPEYISDKKYERQERSMRYRELVEQRRVFHEHPLSREAASHLLSGRLAQIMTNDPDNIHVDEVKIRYIPEIPDELKEELRRAIK
jgi:hypothetical protein